MGVSVNPNQHFFNFSFAPADKVTIANELDLPESNTYADYWEAFKKHPDRMAYLITKSIHKNKILRKVDAENSDDVYLFFQHLEAKVYNADGKSIPNVRTFSIDLFRNQLPESQTHIKNKLLEILNKNQAYVDAFLKNCPHTLEAIINEEAIINNRIDESVLFQLATHSRFLALSLFKKPSLISKDPLVQNALLTPLAEKHDNDLEIADLYASRLVRDIQQQGKTGLQHFLIDLNDNDTHKKLRNMNLRYLHKHPQLAKLLDKNDLAFVFACESEASPNNINYFFDNFNFFLKHNPGKLKELFADVATEEATNQVPSHPTIHQHLFAADQWANKLSKPARMQARILNEKCAETLYKHPEIIKAIYADDNASKNLLNSTNLPKLLSLTRHSSEATKTFTLTLARKNLLTPAATGRIVEVMAQTLSSSGFNQWWKGLKSTANKLISYVKTKVSILAGANRIEAEDKKHELQIINAMLAQRKIKGKLHITTDVELTYIITLLKQNQLEPLTLKALADDSLLWPQIIAKCCHSSVPPAQLSEEEKKQLDQEKKNFITKSPHFYAKIFKISVIDLLLNHPYFPPNITKEDQQKLLSQFDKLLSLSFLKQHIENDPELIEKLLIKADPTRDAERLIWLAYQSSVITKTIIQKGFLHKIFPANHISTLQEKAAAQYFLDYLSDSELTNGQKNYVFDFFNQRGTTEQLYHLASDQVNEEKLIFTSEFQSKWLITPNGNISLKLHDESIAEYIAQIKQKISPEFLDQVLFKAAIHIAHDANNRDRLNEFLNYKLSWFGNHSVLSHVKKLLNNRFKNLELMNNQDRLAFKRDIEYCIRQPNLAKKLEFTNQQLFTINQTKGLHPLTYKSLANNQLYWDQLQSHIKAKYPDETWTVLTLIMKNNPYLFLNHIRRDLINNVAVKTELLANLILDISTVGITDFPGMRKMFLGIIEHQQLNALLSKDRELRNKILEKYTPEKFDDIKNYFPLVVSLLAREKSNNSSEFDAEQLLALAKLYPDMDIPQNANQFRMIINYVETSEINDNSTLLFKTIIENSLQVYKHTNKSSVTENEVIDFLKTKTSSELLDLTGRLDSLQLNQTIVQNKTLFKTIITNVDTELSDNQQVKINKFLQSILLIMQNNIDIADHLNTFLSELSGPQLILLSTKLPHLTESIQNNKESKEKIINTFLKDYLAEGKDFESIRGLIDPMMTDELILKQLRNMTAQKLLSLSIKSSYKEKILTDEKCVEIVINDVKNKDRQYAENEETILCSMLKNKSDIDNLIGTDIGTKVFVHLYFTNKNQFDKIYDFNELLKFENIVFQVLNHPHGQSLIQDKLPLIKDALLSSSTYKNKFNELLTQKPVLMNLLKNTLPEQCADLALKYPAVALFCQNHIDTLFSKENLQANISIYKKLKATDKADLSTTFKEKLLAVITDIDQQLLLIDELPELKDDISISITEGNYQALANKSINNAYLRQVFLQNPGYISKLNKHPNILLAWLNDESFINKLDAFKITLFLTSAQPEIEKKIIDFLKSKEELINQLDLMTIQKIFNLESCSTEFLQTNPSLLVTILNDVNVKDWQADITQNPTLVNKLMLAASGNKSIALALKQSLLYNVLFSLRIANSHAFKDEQFPLIKEAILNVLQNKSFCEKYLTDELYKTGLLRILRSGDMDIEQQLWAACLLTPTLVIPFIQEKEFTKEFIAQHADVFLQLINKHGYDKKVHDLLTYSILQKLMSAENKELSTAILSNTLYKDILENNSHTYSVQEKETINELNKIEINSVEDVFEALIKLKNDERRLKEIATAKSDLFVLAYKYTDAIDKQSAAFLIRILDDLNIEYTKHENVEKKSNNHPQPKSVLHLSKKISKEEDEQLKHNENKILVLTDYIKKIAQTHNAKKYADACKKLYNDANTHSRESRSLNMRDKNNYRANREYILAFNTVKALESQNFNPPVHKKEIIDALIKNFTALYQDANVYIQKKQFLLAEQYLNQLDNTFSIIAMENKNQVEEIGNKYILANLMKIESYIKHDSQENASKITATFSKLSENFKSTSEISISQNLFTDISIDLINDDSFYSILKLYLVKKYRIAELIADAFAKKKNLPTEIITKLNAMYLSVACADFFNTPNAENLDKAKYQLEKFYKENTETFKLFIGQSIPLSIILATKNLDLILFFLREPDLSKNYKADDDILMDFVFKNGGDEKSKADSKAVAKCLYFYKHLHINEEITNRMGKFLGYTINDKSVQLNEHLQLFFAPNTLRNTLQSDIPRLTKEPAVESKSLVSSAAEPVLTNDKVDSVAVETNSIDIPPPQVPPSSNQDEPVVAENNGAPPPPPFGLPAKNDVNKKYKDICNALLKNMQNRLNLKRKNPEDEVNKFIRLFGYDQKCVELNKPDTNKYSLNSFNEKISPHLGEMIEKMRLFTILNENQAFEFFMNKVKTENIYKLSCYNEENIFQVAEFRKEFTEVYKTISLQINEDQKKLVYSFYTDKKPFYPFVQAIDPANKATEKSFISFDKYVVPAIAYVYEKIKDQKNPKKLENDKDFEKTSQHNNVLTTTEAYSLFYQHLPKEYQDKFKPDSDKELFQSLYETICQKADEQFKKINKFSKKPSQTSETNNDDKLQLISENAIADFFKAAAARKKMSGNKNEVEPEKTLAQILLEGINSRFDGINAGGEAESDKNNITNNSFEWDSDESDSSPETKQRKKKQNAADHSKTENGSIPTSTATISHALTTSSSVTSTVVTENTQPKKLEEDPDAATDKKKEDPDVTVPVQSQNGKQTASVSVIDPNKQKGKEVTSFAGNKGIMFNNRNGARSGREPNPPKTQDKKPNGTDFRANLNKTGFDLTK